VLGDGVVLTATYLELTGISGALEVTADRSTLELFRPNGVLLFAASAAAGRRGGLATAWRIGGRRAPTVLAVGTTVGSDGLMPMLVFRRRRRQVTGQLRRFGPFWLAEAAGSRLSVTIDDGWVLAPAHPRRRPGPMRFRIAPSRLSDDRLDWPGDGS